jgi:pyruvate dehydrogenase E2 component (dihydrolipoamide acetyltransferase)
MPHTIMMPALSAGMEEATIARWLKSVGDTVAAGEVIAEIETDKATMELEAERAGTIGRIVAADGTTVAVNAPIALLLAEGEQAGDLGDDAGEVAEDRPASVQQDSVQKQAPAAAAPSTDVVARRRSPASPLARRLAQEKGLEIESLKGSGPRGRIVRVDVEAAAVVRPEMSRLSSAVDPAPLPDPARTRQVRPDQPHDEIPLTNVRKVIARRLSEAKSTIPHFYLEAECEIDALLNLRETLNSQSNGKYKLSVNDFVIKAAALALRQVPEANTAWTDDAILQFHNVDISVAVATDGGLITPIVRQADRAGLASISAEVKALAARARDGLLQPAEYQGGSFTISNLGMFGVRAFSAIINPPQSCILAVGATERRPVVRGDSCVPAMVMSCTLSVDHRAVDGVVGARYLAAFKELIEQPLRLML